MRSVTVLCVALAFSPGGAASAHANVSILFCSHGAVPALSSGSSFTLPRSPDPDQLWVLTVSMPQDRTMDAITYRGRGFARQLTRAEHGARTEIWTLSNPDTSAGSPNVVLTPSAPTPVRVGIAQFAGVHRTDPVFGAVTGAGSAQTTTTASLTYPTGVRTVDGAAAALTGSSDANMSAGTIAPSGSWFSGVGDEATDGPLFVVGAFRTGEATPTATRSPTRGT